MENSVGVASGTEVQYWDSRALEGWGQGNRLYSEGNRFVTGEVLVE